MLYIFLRGKIWYHISCQWFVPCTIEEVFFHAKTIARSNSKTLVKTVESDVAVIVIWGYHFTPNLHELWVEFGKRKDLKYIAGHKIASNLGVMPASALLFFHALNVYDTTTSSLFGKSKKTCDANFFPKLQKCFVKLASV